MRELREEDLRERIRGSGVLNQILDTIEEMRELDHDEEGAAFNLNKLSIVNANRFKLLAKICPDLKAQDLNVSGNLKVVAIDMTGLPSEEPDDYEDDQ